GFTSGMQVYETPNLTYVDSNLPSDTFNLIHLKNGTALTELELATALDHYRSRQLPFCFWTNEEQLAPTVDKLKQSGLQLQEEGLGMFLDLAEYQHITEEQHRFIGQVANPAEISDYAQVIAENWTPPDQNVLSYYRKSAEHFLAQENQISLLIYRHEDVPVGTLEFFPSNEEVVGIYGVSTKAAFRRQGIASALMSKALNTAKTQGFRQVVLLASEAGASVYRKYGFKALTKYYEYV
ncbi:MAG: GNAT family N-acetyltransferase, partial [Bacteroidota bacterium]